MTDAQKQHVKQLQKAAELTWKNVDELSPIDRERLRLDLYEFHMSSGVGMHYLQTEADTTREELSTARMPERYVKDIVERIRNVFAQLAEDKEKDFPLLIKTKPKDIEFNVYLMDPSMKFSLHANMEPGGDAAAYALLRHFEGSGLSLDRVKRCPREGCGNVFILGSHARTDRNRYCSINCSRLAATKVYRAKNKALELAAKGKPIAAIAKELNLNIETVQKWRKEKAARSTKVKKRGRKK
jgi:predicted RNA-binding Zn ribbon-like protein